MTPRYSHLTIRPDQTRVGCWYTSGPADQEYYPGHPDFNLHTVVADESTLPGCVLVENGAGQRFPVHKDLIDQIAAPPERLITLFGTSKPNNLPR